MAKDPAFLFYYQDFLVGTELMSNEETGVYIRILCHLADKGSLCLEDMQSICKGYAFTKRLRSKFLQDENGLFYNDRLRFEVEKRKNYTQSRRENAKAYAKHMENENENKDIKKGVIRGKQIRPAIEEVKAYCLETKSKVDPIAFFNFYEANGWVQGKNKPIKNWKACVATWERNNINKSEAQPKVTRGQGNETLARIREWEKEEQERAAAPVNVPKG